MGVSLKSSRGSWIGLFRKEWAFQKWFIVALVLINLMITIMEISPVFVGVLTRSMTEILASSNSWFLLHLYMGVFLLILSLVNEMKSPDIWLHSTATVAKLVGAKVVVITFAVTCSFLLCGIVIGVTSYVGGSGDSGLEVLSFSSMIFLLVINTVYAMVVSFFIWAIYQVLKLRIGRYSIIVTIAVVWLSVYIWAFVWFSDWFQEIKEFGPILELTPMANGFLYLREQNFIFLGLLPESAFITVGSLFLYVVISLVLFIMGATLFEKKVRL
jgi:hypothetical protein